VPDVPPGKDVGLARRGHAAEHLGYLALVGEARVDGAQEGPVSHHAGEQGGIARGGRRDDLVPETREPERDVTLAREVLRGKRSEVPSSSAAWATVSSRSLSGNVTHSLPVWAVALIFGWRV